MIVILLLHNAHTTMLMYVSFTRLQILGTFRSIRVIRRSFDSTQVKRLKLRSVEILEEKAVTTTDENFYNLYQQKLNVHGSRKKN